MICGGRQHLQHDHPGDGAGQHAGGARPPHQQNPAAALQLLPRLPSIRRPRGKVYNNTIIHVECGSIYLMTIFIQHTLTAGVQVGLLVMIPRALYEILGHWPFGIDLCQVGGGTGRL